MTSLADIRSQFLSYFDTAGHAVVPSAPLVPDDTWHAAWIFRAIWTPPRRIPRGDHPHEHVGVGTGWEKQKLKGKKNEDKKN